YRQPDDFTACSKVAKRIGLTHSGRVGASEVARKLIPLTLPVKAFDVKKAVLLLVFGELNLVWSNFFLSHPFPGRFDIVIEVD
ncbi:MAG: hypothetical protein RLQ73_21505, partial [Hoeflea sp. D1-CHI-28]